VPDKSETKLVEAAFNGDIESFGKLCQRYYGPMVAIAYFRPGTCKPEKAEEANEICPVAGRDLQERC